MSSTSYSATAIIGLNGDPIGLDIRQNSNDAYDYYTFVESMVALNYLKFGDILIYDNASVHTGTDVIAFHARLAENGITTIPLPTYSPELNPIEKVFNVVKNYLRYRRGNRSFLEEILQGFALIDNSLIRKEYINSANYFAKYPFTLPPSFE